MPRGKLIVIDGTNGSGKTEQAKRLVARLEREGHAVGTLSYPRYETPTGRVVKSYLEGVYGTATEVPARQASMLYAIDRWASFKEGDLAPLERGAHVVANRYVASNMGHQGAQILDPEARAEFFRWNDDLEHGLFGIPRPDLNVILHVPSEVTMTLIDKRGNEKDQHENLEHQRAAEAAYLELARSFPNFALVECVVDGRLLSIDEIHELVWTEVRKTLAV